MKLTVSHFISVQNIFSLFCSIKTVPEITAMKFRDDGLTVALGTNTGHVGYNLELDFFFSLFTD